ncbi:PhzF family phenazine biosynthesis protein [Effusibacillus dendaii]|uniref:Phenazine biosynthesis protein n=1 Tax=Effusibacillus dendaii TaxID=2743772 RepID=A0A7I8DCE8_9BACL|nr:PhzF family phenazine biosynthesis protein [Effusibacillus dendaii]BCJ86639.1 phenazine biosynthesis protein [Effusibacillus dendaii]
MQPTFSIVDVFAKEKYAGNQLAVFRGAGSLSDKEMQKIAKEMNYSETTFLLSDEPQGGGYDVRIFTPEEEIPFAGHPTLGTAFVIQQELIRQPVETIVLNLKVGPIPVTFQYQNDFPDMMWMKQNPPVFGKTFDREQIADLLQLASDEIDDRFPVQEVSTGLPAILVPLKNLHAVKRSRVDRTKYFELVNTTEAKAILVFSPETYEPDTHLNARVYVDCLGIPEDPATGSANGNLAGYLVKYRYFAEDRIDIRVEQGYEIGRPSLLHLQAAESQSEIEISVGGNVVMVARGEWA